MEFIKVTLQKTTWEKENDPFSHHLSVWIPFIRCLWVWSNGVAGNGGLASTQDPLSFLTPNLNLCVGYRSGSRWALGAPLPPRFVFKSSSFQAILRENTQMLGSGPPLSGSKLPWPPWPKSWIRACTTLEVRCPTGSRLCQHHNSLSLGLCEANILLTFFQDGNTRK